MQTFKALFVFVFLLVSCNKKTESQESLAILIYNQAYQENFAADTIDEIISNAKNGYVLLDPFMNNVVSSITTIKANGNEVGAYISIGTGENWRDDYQELQPFLVTTAWGQWPNEFFVNSTTTGILAIMKRRIDKIAAWGCDWVEFDNMDWIYDTHLRTTYGFTVTEAEGVAYFNELCDYVHAKGMKCMAKNTVENATHFDGVLYESYDDNKNWWEESGAKDFLNSGKLVIINHYNESNCGNVYTDYKTIYGTSLSFICEDKNLQKYVHFNE